MFFFIIFQEILYPQTSNMSNKLKFDEECGDSLKQKNSFLGIYWFSFSKMYPNMFKTSCPAHDDNFSKLWYNNLENLCIFRFFWCLWAHCKTHKYQSSVIIGKIINVLSCLWISITLSTCKLWKRMVEKNETKTLLEAESWIILSFMMKI